MMMRGHIFSRFIKRANSKVLAPSALVLIPVPALKNSGLTRGVPREFP